MAACRWHLFASASDEDVIFHSREERLRLTASVRQLDGLRGETVQNHGAHSLLAYVSDLYLMKLPLNELPGSYNRLAHNHLSKPAGWKCSLRHRVLQRRINPLRLILEVLIYIRT